MVIFNFLDTVLLGQERNLNLCILEIEALIGTLLLILILQCNPDAELLEEKCFFDIYVTKTMVIVPKRSILETESFFSTNRGFEVP